jgi:6-phosphogluconolactonase (cycloisomerase 2 family)
MANAVHMLRLQEDGSLELLGIQPSHGLATCHVAILPDGRVCAASYLQSCIDLFPVNGDLLEPARNPVRYEGSGPNAARQEASHAHQVVVAPGGRWFYVVDLGADCVWMHDAALAEEAVRLAMPAGHGPRHMAYHPALRRAYVLGEMTGAVTVCDWSESSGMLEVVAVTPAIGEDAAGAAIRVHPSGKALWTSIRSTRSLRYFPLDEKGDPSEAVEVSLGDGEPRDFNISPDGRWLVAANQSAGHLAVIELDPVDGTPVGGGVVTFEMGTPCCVMFVEAGG